VECLHFTGHIRVMTRTVPTFRPQMMPKGGRWFVAVETGNGPDSHVGDFGTEAEALHWISEKAQDWPSKPEPRKRPQSP
jgi:hypothetical protein